MNLDKRMEELVGATFTHDGIPEKLNSYRYANGVWTVCATKKDRRMPSERLKDWLEEITVDESTMNNTAILIPSKQAEVLDKAESSFAEINEMIMKNLRKLNNGERFNQDDLALARATNEGAKTITEMAKVQIDMIKLVNK